MNIRSYIKWQKIEIFAVKKATNSLLVNHFAIGSNALQKSNQKVTDVFSVGGLLDEKK